MENIPDQVLALLNQDTPTMGDQWSRVLKAIGETEPDKSDILRHIFLHYKGNTYYRSCAGCEYQKKFSSDGRITLEELIRSIDPDDRDTAATVILEFNDPELHSLALPLLFDEFPYLQFTAVKILNTEFPDEVKKVLKSLLHHDERWVRDKARKLLGE